jgi:hypothetical protein
VRRLWPDATGSIISTARLPQSSAGIQARIPGRYMEPDRWVGERAKLQISDLRCRCSQTNYIHWGTREKDISDLTSDKPTVYRTAPPAVIRQQKRIATTHEALMEGDITSYIVHMSLHRKAEGLCCVVALIRRQPGKLQSVVVEY